MVFRFHLELYKTQNLTLAPRFAHRVEVMNPFILGKGSPDQRKNGHLTDGDDELLETLVKTATKIPATRSAPRERKRIRNADRKSCKY